MEGGGKGRGGLKRRDKVENNEISEKEVISFGKKSKVWCAIVCKASRFLNSQHVKLGTPFHFPSFPSII